MLTGMNPFGVNADVIYSSLEISLSFHIRLENDFTKEFLTNVLMFEN